MHERKFCNKRIYPTYQPYPVSRDSEQQLYSTSHVSEELPRDNRQERTPEEFSLITDPVPSEEWLSSRPITSGERRPLHPLHLLNSLFTDRLNFLQRALEELQGAQHDREQLTQDALEALDPEIRECEHSLSLALLMEPGQKRHLQRRLLELKRERRRERLLSWRDLVWLRGEIRKLQREIDTLGRTARTAESHENNT